MWILSLKRPIIKSGKINFQYISFWARRVIGILDLWSGQKLRWNWYLTTVLNFGEVLRGLVSQIQSLHLHAGAPGIFSDILRSVQKLKREWGAETAGCYRTYSSLVKPERIAVLFALVKLQLWFLSLRWKTCLWAELQSWCLGLQWKACPWAEHFDDDGYDGDYYYYYFYYYFTSTRIEPKSNPNMKNIVNLCTSYNLYVNWKYVASSRLM